MPATCYKILVDVTGDLLTVLQSAYAIGFFKLAQ